MTAVTPDAEVERLVAFGALAVLDAVRRMREWLTDETDESPFPDDDCIRAMWEIVTVFEPGAAGDEP